MPPVRGGVEDDVVGTALDAAFEHRLERLVGGVVGVERQIVAEHDEANCGRRAAAPSGPAGISISSRWISMSFSPAAGLRPALIAACAALTSDDLPMPRAPHSSALLAGRPRAKRSVFSTRRSRTRSMPLSSDMSTRLTAATGASRRPSGCQTKASAAQEVGLRPAAAAQAAPARRRSASSTSSALAVGARRCAAFRPPPRSTEPSLPARCVLDFAMLSPVYALPLAGRRNRPQARRRGASRSVAIRPPAAIVRADFTRKIGPSVRRPARRFSGPRRSNADYACVCAGLPFGWAATPTA